MNLYVIKPNFSSKFNILNQFNELLSFILSLLPLVNKNLFYYYFKEKHEFIIFYQKQINDNSDLKECAIKFTIVT